MLISLSERYEHTTICNEHTNVNRKKRQKMKIRATTTTTTRAEVPPQDIPVRAAEPEEKADKAAAEPAAAEKPASNPLKRAPPCTNYEDLRTLVDLAEMGENYELMTDLDEIRDITTKLNQFKTVMKGLHSSWKAPTQTQTHTHTHTETQTDAQTISTSRRRPMQKTRK